jgi:hypothetical protein
MYSATGLLLTQAHTGNNSMDAGPSIITLPDNFGLSGYA